MANLSRFKIPLLFRLLLYKHTADSLRSELLPEHLNLSFYRLQAWSTNSRPAFNTRLEIEHARHVRLEFWREFL